MGYRSLRNSAVADQSIEEFEMRSVGSVSKVKMFLIVQIVLVLSVVFAVAEDSAARPDSSSSAATDLVFKHGGLERSYKFYKPENLPANAPLVFVLHGRGQSSSWSYSLGFNRLADANGFAVAYPQGITVDISVPKESSSVFKKEFAKKDAVKMKTQKSGSVCEDGDTFEKARVTYTCRNGQWGKGRGTDYRKANNAKSKTGKDAAKSKTMQYRYTCWNASNQDTDPCRADDVGFLSMLAKHLQAEYDLNPDQTFVTGFSKGGYMSYALACQASDVFRAAAPVAALMDTGVYNTCSPKAPMPILHIHGTADRMVPITGNVDKTDGSIIGPDVAAIIKLWSGFSKCTPGGTATISNAATAHYCRDGIGGNEVHYYKISDHDHLWPGKDVDKKGYVDKSGMNATETIWDFFSKY